MRAMRGKTLETVTFQPYFGCTKSFLKVLSSEYCQATRAMRAKRVVTVPLQPYFGFLWKRQFSSLMTALSHPLPETPFQCSPLRRETLLNPAAWPPNRHPLPGPDALETHLILHSRCGPLPCIIAIIVTSIILDNPSLELVASSTIQMRTNSINFSNSGSPPYHWGRKHYLINSKQIWVRWFPSSNSLLVSLEVLFRTHKPHGIT